MSNGILAKNAGYDLPVEVLKSAAGYYLGTRDSNGPVTRESVGYWVDESLAAQALATKQWQQLQPVW